MISLTPKPLIAGTLEYFLEFQYIKRFLVDSTRDKVQSLLIVYRSCESFSIIPNLTRRDVTNKVHNNVCHLNSNYVIYLKDSVDLSQILV